MTERYYSNAAFPGPSFTSNGHPNGHDMGMSQRDWFAGQAMAGLAAHSGSYGFGNGPSDLADRAYEIADAMLAEREKGGAA